MKHIHFFAREIKALIEQTGVTGGVLTRVESEAVKYVFFYPDFGIFQKLHEQIGELYSIDILEDNMARLTIYINTEMNYNLLVDYVKKEQEIQTA